jgi:hypothetical protein
MNDLARQAAVRIVGQLKDWPYPQGDTEKVAKVIAEFGTLVSHEDAALLDAFRRVKTGRVEEFELSKCNDGSWLASITAEDDEYYWTGVGITIHSALSSALDAAGVTS